MKVRMEKKNQHYVWAHYFSPWLVDGKIWCLRDGRIFNTNPVNVASQRYFYQLEKMTQQDIKFVASIIAQSPDNLRELHKETFKSFLGPQILKTSLMELGVSEADVMARDVGWMIRNSEEELHSQLETKFSPLLHAAVRGDSAIWDDGSLRLNFFHFVCLQYLRTKKMQTNVIEGMDSSTAAHGLNGAGVMGVLRHITSVNMAVNLFRRNREYGFVYLNNGTECQFITSDQPVINTYSVGRPRSEVVEDIELYYPVSPTRAVLISPHYVSESVTNKKVTEDEACLFNSHIVKESHEKILSNSQEVLQSLMADRVGG